jgi:transcriptional regulator GlxA family with amidase domain
VASSINYALAALHAEPERKWTVAELASAAAVSRSVLDQGFREVLGRSPTRYLTEWRMHLADDLLRTTGPSVSAISRCIGYESDEGSAGPSGAVTAILLARGGRLSSRRGR